MNTKAQSQQQRERKLNDCFHRFVCDASLHGFFLVTHIYLSTFNSNLIRAPHVFASSSSWQRDTVERSIEDFHVYVRAYDVRTQRH